MELGRVFISSAFGGMHDLREAAADAAELVGLKPVLTEYLVAQPGSVRSALAREIEACDTYVGLFDRRRGTVPKGSPEDRPRAITEEEFALARELGLRCLVFLSRAAAEDREPGLNDFLEMEITEYSSGLWTRLYQNETELRREIAASLAALRPRVVLSIAPGAEGLESRLFFVDVGPAWKQETFLGPVPVTLHLGGIKPILDRFRQGAASRSQLTEEQIRFLGYELASLVLPGRLGEALDEVLALAAYVRRLVSLEIRTADSAALALPWELINLPRHQLPVRDGLLEVVRRIPRSDEIVDPSRDTAPTVPARHLSVLGFTAAPVEDQIVKARLGTGGFADSDLFWEREQERLLIAFDGLLRERRGRLVLPDTGEKEDLRQRLAQADRPQVVHLACHGGVVKEKEGAAEPALFLEDQEGRREPLRADELLRWVRSAPGDAEEMALLVLSACSTAGAVGEADSAPGHRAATAEAEAVDQATGLAETLVQKGLLRVLGMQSTVSDSGATFFAEKFYTRLADGADLPAALRAGRAELAARGLPHEWAVPTLTTRCDSGPLVAPKGSAPVVEHPFEAVRSVFEIEKVSYLEEGYVGRRDAERRLRKAFEKDQIIAIHGLGGIGKSTLAARFLERRQAEGWRLLVLYAGRELSPATIFEEVAKKLGLSRHSGVPQEEADRLLRAAMKAALQSGPTALYLDNFEDNQDEDGNLLHPALGEALLDLADLGGRDFRIVLTSRLRVDLGAGPVEVNNLDLGELSPSGCRKLRLLDRFEGLKQLSEETWQRVLFHLGGHPKALELLNGYLKGQADRARQLLADLGPALGAVDAKLRAERQEKGRKLLVNAVLETVPEERRPAFDRLCLLDAALPTEELATLLSAEGIARPADDLAWLRDHGFLARTVAPSALAGGDAVHRLLASKQQQALKEREGEEVFRAWHLRLAEHLTTRPGLLSDLGIAARHRDAAGDRAGALELYSRWAKLLRDRSAYAACVQIAQEGLRSYPGGDQEEVRLGEARLWTRMHDGLEPLGQRGDASRALNKILDLLQDAILPESRFIRAGTLMLQGRLLVSVGDLAGAQEKFGAALKAFEEGDNQREKAIALGEIARLRAQAGDVPGAMKLQTERLEVNRRLGDVDGIAAAQFDLAHLDIKMDQAEEARTRLAEAWSILNQLGRIDGIAAVGTLYGQLLASDDLPQALKILRISKDAFLRLEWNDQARELDEIITRLENPPARRLS